jgi:hypothetical protein
MGDGEKAEANPQINDVHNTDDAGTRDLIFMLF